MRINDVVLFRKGKYKGCFGMVAAMFEITEDVVYVVAIKLPNERMEFIDVPETEYKLKKVGHVDVEKERMIENVKRNR